MLSKHGTEATKQLRAFAILCRYSKTPLTYATLKQLRESLPSVPDEAEDGSLMRNSYLYGLFCRAISQSGRNPMYAKEIRFAADYVFYEWPRIKPDEQKSIAEAVTYLTTI